MVPDASTPKDPAWLPDISVIWKPEADLFSIVPDYLARYRAARGEDSLSPEDEAHIKSALNKLHSLPGTYSFTVLQLVPDMTEEEVSQVFVRVNSMGKRLNQADFILTLMSVYWDTGRHELAKMAVSPAEQGKGIGFLLGVALLKYAGEHGVTDIFLEANTRLAASVRLYHKLGFRQVEAKNPVYDRCNLYMEKILGH